jgi:hypothetical protein
MLPKTRCGAIVHSRHRDVNTPAIPCVGDHRKFMFRGTAFMAGPSTLASGGVPFAAWTILLQIQLFCRRFAIPGQFPANPGRPRAYNHT